MAFRPAKSPLFPEGRCLLYRDKRLEDSSRTALAFTALGTAVSVYRLSIAQGWTGRLFFALLTGGFTSAAVLWRLNAKVVAERIYLLPDGRHIDVHFQSFFQPKIRRIPIRDLENNPETSMTDTPIFFVYSKDGKSFSIDLQAIIPDKPMLGAVIRGEDVVVEGQRQ